MSTKILSSVYNWQIAITIIGLFISWRAILFLIGLASPHVFPYQPSFPYASTRLAISGLPAWMYSWGNFDGVHYLTIATEGYSSGLIQAFFPLFPLTIRSASSLISQPIITAVIISNIFFLISLFLFYRLMRFDYSHRTSLLGLVIFVLFPTSFFLGAVYNESMFLCFTFASLIYARRQEWLTAGLWAAAATATRLVGAFLIPALLIELWVSSVDQPTLFSIKKVKTFLKTEWTSLLAILVGCLGLGAYMSYLQLAYADALLFFHVQSEFGAGRQTQLIPFPQVIWRYIKIFITARPINWKFYSYVQEFVVSVGGLGILLLLLKRVRLSYLVFCLGAFLLPTLTGTFSSMPRYVLVCFVLFMWLASSLENKRWSLVSYLFISLLLLIINTMLFIEGYWVA